jgi:hypothetical protein|tara:strand:+ start:184 stop:933 length:750 start_codon:yes stop_codon:yes gene_type:complete
MTTGVLLFCFNTDTCSYHRIAERCVNLIKKNLKLEITIVTNIETFKKFKPLGFINYKLIKNETGNKRGKEQWHNLDRCDAYELSPYDTTLLMDIDYLPFTNNLLEYLDLEEDFLLHDKIHDLTNKHVYDFRDNSIIPMLWATVIVFKKTDRVKRIFETVKYVKKHYQHFCNLYRIDFRNFRNDYAFSIAVNQVNGQTQQNFLPGKLSTLPGIAKVLEITDTAVSFRYENKLGHIENQDVHILDKEIANV